MRCDAKIDNDQCRLEYGHDVHKANGKAWVAEAGYDTIAAARREGVIEGLERALACFPKYHRMTQWDPREAIRAEIERLKASAPS